MSDQRKTADNDQSKRGNSKDNFNLNTNNRSFGQPQVPIGIEKFRGGYCVESPSNTTIYVSAGRLLQERTCVKNINPVKGGGRNHPADDNHDSSDTSYGSDDSIITPNLDSGGTLQVSQQINNLISDLD